MSAFRIEFVNHAGVILRSRETALFCDPWINGTAFHDGWSLLSPSAFPLEGFQTISHIWFSHEHPDHFHVPTLRVLPAESRSKLIGLYHETTDKRVIKFCKSLGFRETLELKDCQSYTIGDLQIRCGRAGTIDSWLWVSDGEQSVLNLNDCAMDNAEMARIRNLVGAIDVLLTQFSYAGYFGNPDQPERRRQAARDKLGEVAHRVAAFRPKFVIPFASFVWFSHEDNVYMNADMNTPRRIYESLLCQDMAVPIILYPGDVLAIGQGHASDAAIARYEVDAERWRSTPPRQAESVDIDKILRAAAQFRERAIKTFGRGECFTFPRLRMFLREHATCVDFSFPFGPTIRLASQETADVVVASDAAFYCFAMNWGFNTLHVNGKFRAVSEDGYRRLSRYIDIGDLMNAGIPWVRSIPARTVRFFKHPLRMLYKLFGQRRLSS